MENVETAVLPEDEAKVDKFVMNTAEDIFRLRLSDISLKWITDTFAIGKDDKSKFKFSTIVVLDRKKLEAVDSVLLKFKNIDALLGKETSLGRILANVGIFDFEVVDRRKLRALPEVEKYTNAKDADAQAKFAFEIEKAKLSPDVRINFAELNDFINADFTKKAVGTSDKRVAALILSETIFPDEAARRYIDNMQWLGYSTVHFHSPSLDMKTLVPDSQIVAKKNQVLRDNKEAVTSNDPTKFEKVEKEVLDFAANRLEETNANGYRIYKSGWNGNFFNNYKVTSIFRGATVKSDNLNEYRIGTSNLVEGVTREEIASGADLATGGALGRAIDTRKGGYLVKIFNAAFAAIRMDKAGTDCGTTGTMSVELTKDNASQFQYRYIRKQNGSLELLDTATLASYIGKTVNMRTPLYCNTKGICNKCIGEMFYRLQISNVGLLVSNIGSTIMGKSMKKFHDASIQVNSINIEDFITKV